MAAKPKRYLAFDCETGGLYTHKHSLLSIAFAVADENLEVIDVLEMKLKDQETNATFKVTAGALAVNKINIIQHNKEAITFADARQKLIAFLAKHKLNKFIPLGHNIGFDFGFVYENLMLKEEFDKFVDYRVLDTATIGRYLKEKGVGPAGRKSSLEHWSEFLGLEAKEEALHTAMFDTLLTVEVYRGMLKLK